MLNLEEVRKLVTALEQDLAKAEGGTADVQALRAEVEALRRALNAPEPGHGWLRDALQSLHASIDAAAETAKVDAAIVAPYIATIGRILGLS
jgi:hypothetical protein